MRGNRGRDTGPEIELRKALWRRGHRYRVHRGDLPGRPDIVFPRERLAVFCDGDFWHGKDWENRRLKLREGSNGEYWVAKIEANRERDAAQLRELRAGGWKVVRLWESEVKTNLERCVKLIEETLKDLRRDREPSSKHFAV